MRIIDRADSPRVTAPLADRIPSWALAFAGVALTVLSQNRWSIPLLGWVAPVPFLLFARRHPGWRGRLALLGAVFLGMTLLTAKIITAPLPWILAPLLALPAALALWGVLVGWDALRRRAGEVAGIYLFPAAVAVLDWVLYRYAGLGTWGTPVNARLDDLELLQLVSVFGVTGVNFLMSWFASAVALTLANPHWRRYGRHLVALGAAIVLAYGYGALRLSGSPGSDTVLAAGVVTDLGPTSAGLPGPAALAANEDQLFARSERGARAGARLIVWNKVATIVAPDDEARLVRRGAEFARRHGVDFVMAYAVVADPAHVHFDNKYVWFDEAGRQLEVYRKHHPAPGEPSTPSTTPLRVLDRPYAATSGAICYDYDFPTMARAQARLGAGLMVVPSSDWTGIDPIHAEIARLRAIEAGASVFRPVRWAVSRAYDQYGRIRASLPVTEANDRVILAVLPTRQVATLYAWWGDTPVAACGAFIAIVVVGVARRRRR